MDTLFDMVQFDIDGGIGGFQPISDGLGEKHGTVLPASATERDHQMVEMAFQIVVDALGDNGFHVIKKHVGLGLGFKVFDHLPVATGFGLELRFTSGIGQCATVEHETAAVAAVIVWVTLLEGKTVDGNGELRIEN